MSQPQTPIIQRSLFSWVFAGNLMLQVLLVIAAIIAVLARVIPLEMQKRIVNEAINLRSTDLLLMYCGIYLIAFITASSLKFCINALQTVIGQRTVAAMRKALYHYILRLPLGFFRKTQPGLVVAAMTTELATAGDFVGMAVSVPFTNLLTLLAFAGYLFWLNPLLGLVSLSIYPLVMLLVPVLQKRVNTYNRKRIDAGRQVSGKVGESVAGIHEIQAQAAYQIENTKFDRLVDKLRKIRIIWKLYRYGVKATNSLFTNFSRFLIFAIGGYLAIRGQLELGALVAFLSAQEKLYTPWKELIRFYQAYQTSVVTYNRTMEYFDERPEHELLPKDRKPRRLGGDVEVKDLSFFTDDGTPLLQDINLSLKSGQHLALVGFSGSGKSTLAHCIIQLQSYSSGQVLIDDHEVGSLSKMDIAKTIGFVSQTPFIFDGTVEENLLYGELAQKHTVPDNGAKDIDMPGLDKNIEALQQAGIFIDVLRFGLNAKLDPAQHSDWIPDILRLRKKFKQEFGEEMADYIEYYNEDRYLYYSNIAENIIFGMPAEPSFEVGRLVQNDRFVEFLQQHHLKMPLVELGYEIARKGTDLLDDLPPSAGFLTTQCPVETGEMDACKSMVKRAQKRGLEQLSEEEQNRLLDLALRFAPGRHRFATLPKDLERRILEGRRRFKESIGTESPDDFSFYRWQEYIPSQSVLANIFYGNLIEESSRAKEKIDHSINQLLIEEEILEDILKMGMQYRVGSKGENLSGGQRQKLAIARAFIKKPNILVMDEATSGLDNNSQSRIQNLLETRWKDSTTLIAVVHRLDIIKNYDKVAVMKSGKLVETGTYDELMQKEGVLYELVKGRS